MQSEAAVAEQWKRNWKVVLAAFLGASLYSMPFYSFSVFVDPLKQEFGWSSAVVGSAVTVVSIGTCLLSPVIGPFIDRRRIITLAAPGVLGYCAAFALLSTVSASVVHWWALWVLMGLIGPIVTSTLWSAVVAKAFQSGRGLALAVTLSGGGVGALVAPIAANAFIEMWGWRAAYAGLGAMYFAVLMPAMLFGLSDYEKRVGQAGPPAVEKTATPRLGLDRASLFLFARLAVASGLTILCTTAILTYLVPIFVKSGLTRGDAALAAGAIGIASLLARLAAGALLDRFNNPLLIGSLAFMLPGGAALALLAQDGSLATAILAAALLGGALGAELDVLAFVLARYFGTANYGGLFGIVYSLVALGQGLGPLLSGFIYDRSGSYDAMLWSLTPICLLSVGLIASLGRPPPIAAEPQAEATARGGVKDPECA